MEENFPLFPENNVVSFAYKRLQSFSVRELEKAIIENNELQYLFSSKSCEEKKINKTYNIS